MNQFSFKEAFKEASADIWSAMLMNMPLNFFLMKYAYDHHLSPITTTLLCTAIFTVISYVRKIAIRKHFYQRDNAVPVRDNVNYHK